MEQRLRWVILVFVFFRVTSFRVFCSCMKGGDCLKQWKCVLVGHHDDVGRVIEEWEKLGWRLQTYACAGNATLTMGTNHYLLFMKGE